MLLLCPLLILYLFFFINLSRAEESTFNDKERDFFSTFCQMTASELLPYLNRCLQALFPMATIAQTLGVTVADLQKMVSWSNSLSCFRSANSPWFYGKFQGNKPFFPSFMNKLKNLHWLFPYCLKRSSELVSWAGSQILKTSKKMWFPQFALHHILPSQAL